MPALELDLPAAELHTSGELDVQECRRDEFYSDTYGLVSTPPPLTIAAALAATTVAVAALVVFVVGEIAGRYSARPRGGAR